ncbi:MAG: hypothetical protein II806_02695, partial [Bacteroidaceae bacterium]|nr:hypothetical protein [Bacteroidaceae bacterium]
MKKLFTIALLMGITALPLMAEGNETSEFEPNGTPGGGFLTDMLNSSLEQAFEKQETKEEKPTLGRTLKDYVSAPKFGGYYIGKYDYSSADGANNGDGFSQRMIRAYVDGTILTDFKYRIQVQINNANFHVKDVFIEWARWKEFSVKLGQYKRAFTFENPYNPWDVGAGDYAQITRMIAGIGVTENGVANGGRDQGLQIQGDLFPAPSDGHRYLHYQLQVMNGQGINSADKNKRKDFIGTIQFQPIKDLFIGVFGWNGNYVTPNGLELERKRWAAGLKYEHNAWTVRAEYTHSCGHEASDYDEKTKTWNGTGKADGWYATVGVPFNSWLKVYVKYDVFRSQATWGSSKSMYSVIPNIQLHKNLLFQLQY